MTTQPPQPDTTPVPDDAVPRATFEALQQELERLKSQAGAPAETPEKPLHDLSPEEALSALNADPVGFIQALIDDAASRHLANLRDEAELNGAVRAFTRERPEFARFAPYVIQEAITIMQHDDDGVIAPWHELLEQGYRAFEKKFQDTLRTNPTLAEGASSTGSSASTAFVEGRANREPTPEPPSFTRQEIARMSLADFLKHESAIEEAMKHKRIR